ncbi:class I SAM-dependent methyltransferase [Paenibacillus mendelii]|uniref:Class I SAM-dependent methyltransferase n=1 Tax=Paenibacillus mendelii TaxID=206163 RepID=A0ABV6JDM7_9BACL|nr:class I SAM-dependent methyltransferase [Paenibacillus mendelii]MCQ6563813.1 class I SAM-dependent methyltransferase [Paenibacillus mendelii]
MKIRLTRFIEAYYGNPKGIFGLWIGEKMVKQHQPETFWTIDLIKLQPNDKVLELGCGAGFAIQLLQNQLTDGHVIGIDLSKTMVRSATIRNKKAIKSGRAEIRYGSAEEIPYPNSSFDKVFSIHSIYFWDDLPRSINEIFRVLKPGGSVIITLSYGKGGVVYNHIQNMIDQQIIPCMLRVGFSNTNQIIGPDSRVFNTVAVTGVK